MRYHKSHHYKILYIACSSKVGLAQGDSSMAMRIIIDYSTAPFLTS